MPIPTVKSVRAHDHDDYQLMQKSITIIDSGRAREEPRVLRETGWLQISKADPSSISRLARGVDRRGPPDSVTQFAPRLFLFV